jgi:hypothetical protein
MNMISKKSFESTEERNEYMVGEYGGPKDVRLEQPGDLDIQFKGWLVSACGDHTVVEDPDKSSVEVRLYFTDRGSYVAEIVRNFPDFRAGGKRVVRSRSSAFSSPRDMLSWLKEDGKGWLGVNSKIAWEEMCSRLPWLLPSATIRV